MDSEVKSTGTTEEEEIPSVLDYLKKKVRSVLLRKWRNTRATFVAEAMAEGMTEEALELYLSGFKRGYWSGAVDVSSVHSKDLRQGSSPPSKTVKAH